MQHDEAGQVLGLAPRPYSTHEPMLGRPVMIEPVFMNVCAGSWLICSVHIERTMQISSAMLPMCGNSSQISCPDLPNCLKPCCGPKQVSFWPCSWAICWPLVNDSGIGLPCISASFGL